MGRNAREADLHETGADGPEEERRAPWRHQALAERLLARIVSGEYAVGESLPTERRIAETEKVSRATVREALRSLENRGMIRRRQGSGTVVISAAPQQFRMPLDSIDSLLSHPGNTHAIVYRDDPADPADPEAAALGLSADRPWRRIAFIRRVNGSTVPVSLSTVYFPDAYSGVIPLIGGGDSTVSALIEKTFAIRPGEVKLQMEATAVGGALAAVLGVPEGTAAIRIDRSYYDEEGRPYERSITIHPQDRYTFEIVLKRHGGE